MLSPARTALLTTTAAAALGLSLLAGCAPKPAAEATPAPAAAAEDPTVSAKAFAAGLYARYGAGDFNPIVTREGVWDPTMLAIMTRVDAAQVAGDGAIFDFDPLCGCQDDTGMTARVTEASSSGPDAARVTVERSFPAANDTASIRLSLVKVAGAWRIHDIATDDVPSYAAHLEQAMAAEG